MSATALPYGADPPPQGLQSQNLPNNPILINPSAFFQHMNQLSNNQNLYSQAVTNQPSNQTNQSNPNTIINSKNTPLLQPIHPPRDETSKSFIAKFVSNLSFPEEKKGFLKLQREIKRCKPNANILNAYVNKKNELIIRNPNNRRQQLHLRTMANRCFPSWNNSY